MIKIVGEHATTHLKYDAPLTSDIEGLARPVSHWVRRADSAHAVSRNTAAAIAQTRSRPGKIATLILPGETSWEDAGDYQKSTPVPASSTPQAPDSERVEHVARILRSGEPALTVFAGHSTRGCSLELAGRVAAHTGCRMATQFFTARIERGAGRTPLEGIPLTYPRRRHFYRTSNTSSPWKPANPSLSSVTPVSRANSAVTMAMKDGRVTSSLVQLDYCGPKLPMTGSSR